MKVVRARTIASSLAAFCACSFALPAARAAEHPSLPDPVAAALDRCLAKPSTESTLDVRDCYRTAARGYETRIASTYASILKHVDPASQSLVRNSQQAWLAYRNRVLAVDRGSWTGDRGTIVGIEIDEANVSALRARLVELRVVWPGFAGEDASL